MPVSPNGERYTLHPKSRRRWTLNGDFSGLAPTGVARYASETIAQIDKLVGESHPLTLDLDLDLVSPHPVHLRHIRNVVVGEFGKPRIPQFWSQVQLPRMAPGGLVSFCNLAPVMKSHHIACIHDLHTFMMPESFSAAFRGVHRAILPALGRRAKRITTVSAFSADQLAACGVAARDKIFVTYNGSDHAEAWSAARAELELPTTRPFIVCFARPHPYKNIAMVRDLAPRLDEMGIDVVFVGAFDPANLPGPPAQLSSNVQSVGRIGDNDLAHLFANALCLLFPSRIEGFGLPAVEAMVHGCPVVASSAPCMPEICGDAAMLAAPDEPAEWLEAISRLCNQPELRSEYIERGYKRAEKYRWRRVAELYLELMRDLDDEMAGGEGFARSRERPTY